MSISLADPAGVTGVDFAAVCTVANRGGASPQFWAGAKGKAVLRAHDGAWQSLLNRALHLNLQTYDRFQKWLATPGGASQLAAAMLNVAFGAQDGDATVHDSIVGDWPAIRTLLTRANGSPEYGELLQELNANKLPVTPSKSADCGPY